MKCLECGKELVFISFRHLKSCCGLTQRQYKEKHVGCQLMDDSMKQTSRHVGDKNGMFGRNRTKEEKQKISFAVNEAMNNPAVRYKCGTSHRGKTWEEILGVERAQELKAERSEKQSGINNHYFGKKHSSCVREKMSKRRKNFFEHNDNPLIGRKISEKRKADLSVRRKQYWATKTKEEKLRLLGGFIVAGQKSNKKCSKTKIERTFAEALQLEKIPFKWNEPLFGKNVDFVLGENIVVECYGDYWHCNPSIYVDDFFHKDIKKTAKEIRFQNAERLEIFRRNGFTVFVVWEKEFKDGSWKNVLEKIKDEYKKQNCAS